jgi:hypothetical protein
MKVKNIQLWVHRNYDLIKLAMLTLILIFAALTFFRIIQNEIQDNQEKATAAVQEAEERSRNVERGIAILRENTKEINRNTDRVAALIACLLEIHGRYTAKSKSYPEKTAKLASG